MLRGARHIGQEGRTIADHAAETPGWAYLGGGGSPFAADAAGGSGGPERAFGFGADAVGPGRSLLSRAESVELAAFTGVTPSGAGTAADGPVGGAGGAGGGDDGEGGSPLTPSLLMAASVGIIAIVLLRRLRKRSRRQRFEPDQDARERIEALHAAAAERQRVESYGAEAEELTRRMAAILDAKSTRLEILLERAEVVLSRLERAEGVAGAGVSDARPTRASWDADHPEYGDEAQAGPLEPEEHEHEPRSVQDRVTAMLDEGYAPAQVAARVGLPLGEVELIGALRRG